MIGIKSTALLFGAKTQTALLALYGLSVTLIGIALMLAGSGWFAWAGLVGLRGASRLADRAARYPRQRRCA